MYMIHELVYAINGDLERKQETLRLKVARISLNWKISRTLRLSSINTK